MSAGGASRNKGKAGERELATLLAQVTGHDVRRRVRQHDGDSDLEGLPGWSIECKRYASASPALVAVWWAQACRQARRTGTLPVLLYRLDRGQWQAVWSADHHTSMDNWREDFDSTLSASPSTWWAMCRHLNA